MHETPPASSVRSLSTSPRTHHLLIVDGEALAADAAKLAWEQASIPAGHVMCSRSVRSAEAALVHLRSELAAGRPLPELMLMDLKLQGRPGTELLAEVRGDAHLGALPVMVVTAETDAGQRAFCIAQGVQAFAAKPQGWLPYLNVVRSLVELWIHTTLEARPPSGELPRPEVSAPQSCQQWETVAGRAARNNDHIAAVAACTEACKLQAGEAAPHRRCALLLLKHGWSQEAARFAARALSLDPGCEISRDVLRKVRKRTG